MTPKELYDLRQDPTLTQLMNAYNGKMEMENSRIESIRNIVYGASRFNAQYVGGSLNKEVFRTLSKHKFPWEDDYRNPNTGAISYDAIKGQLQTLEEQTNSKKAIKKKR